jgi:uncharacterized protein (DUF2062 family)
MFRRLRRLLPHPRRLRQSRWLSWLGPRLHHPALWHWRPHEVALGTALGVFFSCSLPVAHMATAGVAAVALRANVVAAVASTWVVNPVTMGPIYYGAYRLGHWVVGSTPADPHAAPPEADTDTNTDAAVPAEHHVRSRIFQYGKPLLAGMAMMATVAALASYAVTRVVWWVFVWVRLKRERRWG